MIRLKHIATILLIVSCITGMTAANDGNRTALPAELYMLPNTRNHLFTQSFLKRWLPYEFHTVVSGDCRFERRIPAVTTVTDPTDGDRLTIDLVDGRDFSVISTDTVTLHVGQNACSAPVYVQIIGDSFVQGAFYRAALIDSMNVPGIRTVGLRKLNDSLEHFDEGRGGWTLKDYFSIAKGEFTPYAGFMQPADERRYLGACRFWINCHKVQNRELTDFESRYQCGRFENYACRFDPQSGLPLSPAKNDLMWDDDRDCFICYDGRKWVVANDVNESEWRFDYGKYLQIWNLRAPDFLFETLGLNDFRDVMQADYSEWDSLVTQMKDSYLKANPKGMFAIVIPCSSCGSMNNRRGDFTARQNACMWNFRKHLIETFDCRKDEGFHIVDMGITIDNENGYRLDDEGLQTGNPHPYPNYPEMGMPLAAFIQYYRK